MLTREQIDKIRAVAEGAARCGVLVNLKPAEVLELLRGYEEGRRDTEPCPAVEVEGVGV
jgi:hypothetical protein